MLRLSSYGSSTGTGTGAAATPSPSPEPTTTTTSRSDPLDEPRPHEVLQARARELHKLVTQLASWFSHVAQLHHHHALALDKLEPLPVPFFSSKSSTFIPLSHNDHTREEEATLGGTGREGWQDIFAQANSTQSRIAAQHAHLAKHITADVVNPLNKLAFQLKTHAQLLEKELKPLVDAVARERHLVQPLYTRLANAIALVQQPAATSTSSSLWGSNKGPKKLLSPHDDPVLVRAQIEARLRVQLDREHDLVAALQKCTHKSLDRELSAFDQVKQCWSAWESLHSASLLESHQLGMFLAATVDAVPNDKEWLHFAVDQGMTIPDDEPDRTLDDLDWVGKNHELTHLVKEGLLERQTSILKSWKPAYFILTPSGILHVYTPPASSVVLPDPSSSETAPPSSSSEGEEAAQASASASLSPIAHYLALHASPQFSLNLSHCFLGPMPTPSPAALPPAPPSSSPSSPAAEEDSPAKGKLTGSTKKPVAALDAVFTLIEATVSNGGRELTMPSNGGGTRHVVRCRGENGWEEMGGWVAQIGKYCAVPSVPPPPSPPTPIAPVMASTTTAATSADEPPSNNTTTDEAAAAAAPPPATVLARSLPPLPPSLPPPALPERTGSAFTLSGHGPPPPPPALPPRDSFLSQASSSSSSTGAMLGDGDESIFSTEGGNQSYGDMSHVMASFGLLGAGAGAGAGVGAGVGVANANKEGDDHNTPATTVHEGDTDAEQNVAASDEEEKKEEEADAADAPSTDGEGEGDESGGDLGRSVPEDDDDDDGESVVAASSVKNDDSDNRASGSGSKVKNLAAAWEQQQQQEEQGGGGDDQKGEEETAGLTVPKGKKGKKKRKSKGGGKDSNPAAAAVSGSQEDKALPTPSDDPESSDLGMPSPHSPSFESAPSSPKPENAVPESEHESEQNVDLGEPELEEGMQKDGGEEEGASKPPMELEEVVEAPEQHEPSHEHQHADEGEGADAQPGDEDEQHKSEHEHEHDDHHH